ncbi:hypothetical protein chiPu_0028056, partial [Chiloscyllium punctatum]|nr:hypothetical protein [Chiloscyllium punctatum]
VRFGQQKRYQDWFQRQYLSTPDSQSLRCDLIRYICGVVHPSNEVLSSDILPRWAIIGWLLTTCTVSRPGHREPEQRSRICPYTFHGSSAFQLGMSECGRPVSARYDRPVCLYWCWREIPIPLC